MHTLHSLTERPSCYNRKPYTSGPKQDGWVEVTIAGVNTRIPRMVEVPFTMSQECPQWGEYGEAKRLNWNCGGCRWAPKCC